MARHRVALATALFVILPLAFALRLYRLGQADIWWDEGFSVWLARFDPVSIAQMTVVDEHPPLHYWFLSLWTRLAGETEVATTSSGTGRERMAPCPRTASCSGASRAPGSWRW